MEFIDVLNKRYSCRSFQDKKIEKETLDKLLSLVSLAPSACNFQSAKVLVIDDPALLEKMNEITKFTFGSKAILVVMHDNTVSWHRRRDNKDHGIIDSSIIATYLMTGCFELGLATTYVSAFNDELIHQLLNIPSNLEVNCLLPIGYPSDDAKPADFHYSRKDLKEVIFFNEIK